MQQSLTFLYQRIKNPKLTKEQAESKVCQEVFIMKIGSSKLMNKRIAFKGGLIIDSYAKGARGYTKDIDFDFIRYPLSSKGLSAFIDDLNNTNVFSNITISIRSIEELRHKNYQGKRINLVFTDGKSKFYLLVDIGVYFPIIKKNNSYEYEVAFGGISSILVNPIERVLAEKLSTFAVYGTDNTRAKDLFDAYWIIKHYQLDKNVVFQILEVILVNQNHYFKSSAHGKKAITNALENKSFKKILSTSKRNWTNASLEEVLKTVIKFIQL